MEEVIQLVCVEIDLNPKVQFMSYIDPDVPETLISDYRRLKQVIINLLRNSVKFTQKGHISLKVQKKRLAYLYGDETVAI